MSDEVRCVPVQTRRDEKAFLKLEREVYQGDPHWVPPIWQVRREMVGFKPHPFYEDADRQAFLVRRGDRVVGRVLAIVNHAHNRRYDEQRGFFGFSAMSLTELSSLNSTSPYRSGSRTG